MHTYGGEHSHEGRLVEDARRPDTSGCELRAEVI